MYHQIHTFVLLYSFFVKVKFHNTVQFISLYINTLIARVLNSRATEFGKVIKNKVLTNIQTKIQCFKFEQRHEKTCFGIYKN